LIYPFIYFLHFNVMLEKQHA